MGKIVPIWGLLAAAVLANGCTAVALTAVDSVASYATEADCSTSQVVRGEAYCKTRDRYKQPKVTCFPTLGEPNCIAEEDDPYAPDNGKDVAQLPIEERANLEPARQIPNGPAALGTQYRRYIDQESFGPRVDNAGPLLRSRVPARVNNPPSQ